MLFSTQYLPTKKKKVGMQELDAYLVNGVGWVRIVNI